ncbi:hypothetical protein [Stetteria hydrogenophila]
MERGSECRVRLVDGLDAFRAAVEELLATVYSYNARLRGTGYYLKPLHRVYKRDPETGALVVYEYYGRYWWRLERRGGRLRWRYAGREPPPGVPEPPRHPLEGMAAKIEGSDVELECRWYEELARSGLLRGVRVERVH